MSDLLRISCPWCAGDDRELLRDEGWLLSMPPQDGIVGDVEITIRAEAEQVAFEIRRPDGSVVYRTRHHCQARQNPEESAGYRTGHPALF